MALPEFDRVLVRIMEEVELGKCRKARRPLDLAHLEILEIPGHEPKGHLPSLGLCDLLGPRVPLCYRSPQWVSVTPCAVNSAVTC